MDGQHSGRNIDGSVRRKQPKRRQAPQQRIGPPSVACGISRIASLTAAISLAALAIAACGGSKHPASTTAVAANTALQLARCMRANGVPDFPDPRTSTDSAISVQATGSNDTLIVNGVALKAPAFRSAMTRCQTAMPTGSVSAARLEQIRSGALAMARCMRAHEVPNFPDPVVSNGAEGLIVTGNLKAAHIDITAPAFQHAMNTCQPLEGLPSPTAS